MAESMPRIHNFHVAVKELSNNVIFLRKLEQGGSEHSFGIHVAKMAGIPSKVIIRAQEMLQQLEASRSAPGKVISKDEKLQLSFFQLDDPVLAQVKEEIVKTDIDNIQSKVVRKKTDNNKRIAENIF